MCYQNICRKKKKRDICQTITRRRALRSGIIHQSGWSLFRFVCFVPAAAASDGYKLLISCPKVHFIQLFPCRRVLLSFSTKIKAKEEKNAQREQIKAIRLHINCRRKRWYQRTPLPILRYQHNTSITSKNKPRTDFWRNAARCDNAVARCPLLADRAYNELKRGENIGLIIHGSFVNQWRGIRPVNRLEDLFWLQNGNKGPFTTWMGQPVIKKPALKQREKEFCGSTSLTPGRTTAC